MRRRTLYRRAVARGQTNGEAAAAMFVTENTQQTHVRHIFRKLAVRFRTALVARFSSASASTAAATHSAADQNRVEPDSAPFRADGPEFH